MAADPRRPRSRWYTPPVPAAAGAPATRPAGVEQLPEVGSPVG